MTPEPTAGVETELKFELDAEAVSKLREHPAFADPQPPRRLRSVYFDTPDHDLRNCGLTLRVREASGAYVQTVKQRQNGLFGRGGVGAGSGGRAARSPRLPPHPRGAAARR